MKKSALKNPDLCKKKEIKNLSLKSFYIMTAEHEQVSPVVLVFPLLTLNK